MKKLLAVLSSVIVVAGSVVPVVSCGTPTPEKDTKADLTKVSFDEQPVNRKDFSSDLTNDQFIAKLTSSFVSSLIQQNVSLKNTTAKDYAFVMTLDSKVLTFDDFKNMDLSSGTKFIAVTVKAAKDSTKVKGSMSNDVIVFEQNKITYDLNEYKLQQLTFTLAKSGTGESISDVKQFIADNYYDQNKQDFSAMQIKRSDDSKFVSIAVMDGSTPITDLDSFNTGQSYSVLIETGKNTGVPVVDEGILHGSMKASKVITFTRQTIDKIDVNAIHNSSWNNQKPDDLTLTFVSDKKSQFADLQKKLLDKSFDFYRNSGAIGSASENNDWIKTDGSKYTGLDILGFTEDDFNKAISSGKTSSFDNLSFTVTVSDSSVFLKGRTENLNINIHFTEPPAKPYDLSSEFLNTKEFNKNNPSYRYWSVSTYVKKNFPLTAKQVNGDKTMFDNAFIGFISDNILTKANIDLFPKVPDNDYSKYLNINYFDAQTHHPVTIDILAGKDTYKNLNFDMLNISVVPTDLGKAYFQGSISEKNKLVETYLTIQLKSSISEKS